MVKELSALIQHKKQLFLQKQTFPLSFLLYMCISDSSRMGNNEPLRGLRRCEFGPSAGVKYGARGSGSFVMQKAHAGEHDRRQPGVSALRRRGFSSDPGAGTAHVAWCVIGCLYCPVCVSRRWSALPAVVQKMRGQYRDEDVLPVHRKEQSSCTVDACS